MGLTGGGGGGIGGGTSNHSSNGSFNSRDGGRNKKAKSGSSKVNLLKLPKAILNAGKYPKPKIVKDAIPLLDDELQVLTRDAPFIEANAPNPNIVLLDRKEVIVGEMLGQGQFAHVFSVQNFELRPPASPSATTASSSSTSTAMPTTIASTASTATKAEQAKRHTFVQEYNNHQSDCHSQHCCRRYAIKHLKRDLLLTPARRRIMTLRLKASNNKKAKTANSNAAAAGEPAIPEADVDAELPMDQQFQLAAADLVVEALYLSRLQHKHIVAVRGLSAGGTTAFGNGRYDSYFLILDKLAETLDQRIRNWRQTMGSPQEAQLMTKTYYAFQMAQALEYLHRRRIVFRDLKPSNIGFTEQNDQVLQIFDFGLCRELPPRTAAGAVYGDDGDPNEVYFMTAAGTHRYMAVEVLMGQQYNAKADVYSFAMVFYELLAQEAPFLNFDDQHHRMLVCERKHRPNHFFGCVVPQSIHQLLADAWEHEIADRLTMKQVVTRLEDVLVNTFQQTVQEGPDGVKVLEEDTNRSGAAANHASRCLGKPVSSCVSVGGA